VSRRSGCSDVGWSEGSAAPRYIYLYPGRIATTMASGDLCGVQGCGKEARRSLSTKKVKEALPDLKLIGEPRRTHLCKDHYRQFRKKTKQERENERATWQ
jgi:hypothetical protein